MITQMTYMNDVLKQVKFDLNHTCSLQPTTNNPLIDTNRLRLAQEDNTSNVINIKWAPVWSPAIGLMHNVNYTRTKHCCRICKYIQWVLVVRRLTTHLVNFQLFTLISSCVHNILKLPWRFSSISGQEMAHACMEKYGKPFLFFS